MVLNDETMKFLQNWLKMNNEIKLIKKLYLKVKISNKILIKLEKIILIYWLDESNLFNLLNKFLTLCDFLTFKIFLKA